MTVQSPYIVPGLNPDAVTQNLNLNQNSDTSPVILATGRHGDQLVSEVHGKRYHKASRNNQYIGTGVTTTGAAILAPGGTTSGVCFGMPVSASKYMEVERIRVVPFGATVVVAALGLEYGAVPVSTTYQTISAMPVGAGTTTGGNQGKVWDAVTIVAMAWLRALPIWFDATTDVSNNILEVDFDGSLIIAPGYAVNLVSTTTQGAIKFLVDVEWSEWLP